MPRCSHKACDLAATAHKPCHYRNLIFEGARGYSKCTNFAFLCRRLRHVIPRKQLPGCLHWPQYIRKNLNVHGVVQPQSALESVFPCVFYRFFFRRLCAKDVSQVIHIYIYIYAQNIDGFQDVGTQLRLMNRPSCASHSLAGKKMAAVQVFVHETTLSACKERIC